MSQINDALRRAREAANSGAAVPLPPPPPLPPVHAAVFSPPPALAAEPDAVPEGLADEPTSKSRKLQLVLAVLVVVCVLGMAFANYWSKKHSAALAQAVAQPGKKPIIADAHTRQASSNVVEAALAHVSTSAAPATTTPAAATKTTTVNVAVATPVAPVAPAAPPVKFPPLKLQSIFYRPASPSVIINNKTLFVSDEIQGVAVADIQPSSVTLVLSGQTNVLTLR